MNVEELIPLALSRREQFVVAEKHGAAHIGSGTVRVLATPWMIAFMEITARKMLDEPLPDSHTTVGTHVDVRHHAASPIGAKVEVRMEVISQQGKRIQLSAEIYHGDKLIGSGQHERVIIEKEKFLARLPKGSEK